MPALSRGQASDCREPTADNRGLPIARSSPGPSKHGAVGAWAVAPSRRGRCRGGRRGARRSSLLRDGCPPGSRSTRRRGAGGCTSGRPPSAASTAGGSRNCRFPAAGRGSRARPKPGGAATGQRTASRTPARTDQDGPQRRQPDRLGFGGLGERGDLLGCPGNTLGHPADGPIEGVAADRLDLGHRTKGSLAQRWAVRSATRLALAHSAVDLPSAIEEASLLLRLVRFSLDVGLWHPAASSRLRPQESAVERQFSGTWARTDTCE